jgi:hypothetical protein
MTPVSPGFMSDLNRNMHARVIEHWLAVVADILTAALVVGDADREEVRAAPVETALGWGSWL